MIKAIIFDLHGVLIVGPNLEENIALTSYLKELKEAGLKLFVLSNSTKEAASSYVTRFPFLNEIFDQTYYSGETGLIKPDPKAYQYILDERHLKPAECLYFDDSPSYIEVATQLGIKSFLYKDVGELKIRIQSSSVMHN